MDLDHLSEEIASQIFEFFYSGALGASWDDASQEVREHFLKLADDVLDTVAEEIFEDIVISDY